MTAFEKQRASVKELEAAETLAKLKAEQAEKRLSKEIADPRELVTTASEDLVGKTRSGRINGARAALEFARRDASRAGEELAQAKATTAALGKHRGAVEEFESAMTAARELEAEVDAIRTRAIAEVAARTPKLRQLAALAGDRWTRIPLDARAGLEPPVLVAIDAPAAVTHFPAARLQ